MYTYDVYLKRRLTEIDVIITQLVQRDSFAMYDWLTLFATMDDLEIRKALKIESEMTLDTSLEDFLEYVHEKINSEMYLDVSVDLLRQVLAEGETEMVLSADELDILEKTFISGNSILEISVSPLDYYIAHSFGKVEFNMEMLMNDLQTLKYSLEKFENQFVLTADIDFSSQKNIDVEELSMFLDVAPTDIFYLLTIGGNAITNLYTQPLDEYVLKKVLHDLDLKMTLSANVSDVLEMTKAAGMEDILNIFSEIVETIIQFVQPTTVDMTISCEASAGLKRYRLLSEMDNLTLSDFDDMTLNEVDYVILAE